MLKLTKIIFFMLLANWVSVQAAEKLVLDIDMDSDLISMTHHIDGFVFQPTMNFSKNSAGNISDRMRVDTLKNHLAATAVVRINGKISGFATEHEIVVKDPESGRVIAESAWLIILNRPGLTGFIAVKQVEDAGEIFGLVGQVMQNPDGDWENEFQRFLSTSNSPKVQMATGDLAVYQGGLFEEYSYVNPADFKNFNRFRAKIQFVIYPSK